MGDDFPDDLTVDAEILVHDPVAQADDKGSFNVATPFADRIRKAARSLTMPAVYPAILSIDSIMSSTRRRSALRDLNAVRLEDRLHPGTNGA
jgi:hypothetical protein